MALGQTKLAGDPGKVRLNLVEATQHRTDHGKVGLGEIVVGILRGHDGQG